MPQGGEGGDEAADRGGADSGEVARQHLLAVVGPPTGLVDHAANKRDLLGEGRWPRKGLGRMKDEG